MIRQRTLAAAVAWTVAAFPLGAASTFLVRDINPSPPEVDVQLRELGPSVAGYAPFWTHQWEGRPVLWSTDGTTEGTAVLTDLIGGTVDNPQFGATLCVGGSSWFFESQNLSSGEAEIWRTNGTIAGTALIRRFPANFLVGVAGWQEPHPDCADHTVGPQLLFLTTRIFGNSQQDYQLWRTDGTAAGTFKIKDLGEGVFGDGSVGDIQSLGESAVFIVNTLASGFQLWRTDGTSEGTVPFFDSPPGHAISPLYPLEAAGDLVFFGLSGDPNLLGATDGTLEGTEIFEELSYPGLHPNLLTVGTRLLVTATHPGPVRRLWSIDLQSLATTQLTDSPPYAQILEQPPGFAGGRGLFLAESSQAARVGSPEIRLLASDGTPAGTYDVGQVCAPGGLLCEPRFLGSTPLGMVLGVRIDGGYEIVRTGGVAGDITSIATVDAPDGPQTFGVTTPDRLFVLFDSFQFGDQLWTFDGSPAGSVQLNDPDPPAESFSDFGKWGLIPSSVLVFAGSSGLESGLWKSDGTPAGTQPYFEPPVDAPGSNARSFSPSGSRVLFSATDATSGGEPWVSDATTAGSFRVADLTPGPGYSAVETAVPAGTLWPISASPLSETRLLVTEGEAGEVWDLGDFFPILDSAAFAGRSVLWAGWDAWSVTNNPPTVTHLAEIFDMGFPIWNELSEGAAGIYFRNRTIQPSGQPWITDGTPTGTRPYCAAPAAPFREGGSRVVEAGPGIVLCGDDEAFGDELFYCAGESSEAQLLRDIHEDGDSRPHELVRAGARILFAATDSGGDTELWVTDATPAGTGRVADIFPDGSSNPQHLVSFAGQVVFAADDGVHGREPWISDGTPEGTLMIADLAPGAQSSNPAGFALRGSTLYFAAETLATGRELWYTGGTGASTGLLADLRPGPASSDPEEITPATDRLFFRATDHRGTELWADWAARIFGDGFETGDTSLWDLP